MLMFMASEPPLMLPRHRHPRGTPRAPPQIKRNGAHLIANGEAPPTPHESRDRLAHELAEYRMQLSSFGARMERQHVLSSIPDPAVFGRMLLSAGAPRPSDKDMAKIMALPQGSKLNLWLEDHSPAKKNDGEPHLLAYSVHKTDGEMHLYREPLRETVRALADTMAGIHLLYTQAEANRANLELFKKTARTVLNRRVGMDVRKILPYLALTQPHGRLNTFSALVHLAGKTGLTGDLAVKDALGIRHALKVLGHLPPQKPTVQPSMDPLAD